MADFIGATGKNFLVHEEVRAIAEILAEELRSPKIVLENDIRFRFHAHNAYLTKVYSGAGSVF